MKEHGEMKIGLLWADDGKGTMAERVMAAARCYERKFGVAPTVCFASSKDMAMDTDMARVVISGVMVMPMKWILEKHLWIGVGNDEQA